MSALAARQLSKRYGASVALDGVSLEASAGSILCILGPSGGGKSTLVRHLNLLEAPDAGEVLLGGIRAPIRGPEKLAAVRRFGLVQQRPGLLRGTVLQNVAFPLRARGQSASEARNRAAGWIDRLGLKARMHALADELSGGEAQRVALARALAPRPEILLVDEATNQLDPHWVRAVEGLLREEAGRGCAVVLVTHNVPQALRIADSFAFLEAGRVVERGKRERLNNPETPALRFFLETGS